MEKVYIVPNPTGPTQSVSINPEKCISCNSCADVCRVQTIMPNPEKGKPPVIVYPDECWYCACCVEACPTGALAMNLPINQRILFKRKDSGQVYRIGQNNPLPKSYFRPPAGWMENGDNGEKGVLKDVWQLLLNKKDITITALVHDVVSSNIAKMVNCQSDPSDKGKLAAMLHRLGFESVVFYKDNLNDFTIKKLSGDGHTIIVISPTMAAKQVVSDWIYAILTTQELAKMWKRACVSNYTAAEVWEHLEKEEYLEFTE